VLEALKRIDRAHQAPFSKPNELEYCAAVERWAVRLRRLAGEEISTTLRLGARAQHLERGAIPRKSYPEGRDPYLRWRAAVKKRQGQRVEEILSDLASSLGRSSVSRVKGLVAKSLPLRPHTAMSKGGGSDSLQAGDAEMQCIEDAACLVFLEQELKDGFAEGKDDAKMVDIFQKTWRKMSRLAHEQALTLEYSPRMLGCIAMAIAEVEAPPCERSRSLLPVPALSEETRQVLADTWACCISTSYADWGEAWYEELRQSPGYADELGKALSFPVCRAENIAKTVAGLISLLPATEEDQTTALDIGGASAPKSHFAQLLRAAALLAQMQVGLRLRHLDPLRVALVAAACKKGAAGLSGPDAEKRCFRAWEAFSYAVGGQIAPLLMLSDPTEDFAGAVATALPTPGAVPCAALLAAKGLGLVEMSLHILQRKRQGTGLASGGEASSSEVVVELGAWRSSACRAAGADAHAYCGFLAAAVFDTGGHSDVHFLFPRREERLARRTRWTRRCTEQPLIVADLALRGLQAAEVAVDQVKAGARSAIGDLLAGGSLLLESARLALKMADLNLEGASKGDLEDFLQQARDLHERCETLAGAWHRAVGRS